MDSCAPGFPAKFQLQKRIVYPHQRSGWAYAVGALEPLFSNDGDCILLDTMIEKNFCRRLAEARRNREVPYRRPWVGFVHVPPDIPRWHDYEKSFRYISRLKTWKDSYPHCRGLLTLSAWMGRWLRTKVDVPVLHLRHPTQTPATKFTFSRFQANGEKRVIQVGWWLRRLCSIHELPARHLRKAVLLPYSDPAGIDRIYRAIERERNIVGAPPLEDWEVEVIPYRPPEDYDTLLAENVIFLHLFSSVANNAIIECIVRNTPVLVNPLPSVLEHLGEAYPLYYRSLDEAAAKAEDMSLLRQAHEYLVQLPKQKLTGENFRRSLAESEFYQRL